MTEQTLSETIFCANHPQTPTALRCNKCGKPICTKCAVRTPVGYRCRECVRSQQQIFETAEWYDYIIAGVIAAPLAAPAGFLISYLGFFVLFLSPVAGGVIAEIIRAAVRRRRSRYLSWAAAGAFVLGCLPLFIIPLIGAGLGLLNGAGGAAAFSLVRLLWPLVYTIIGASMLYARLRGISIR